MKIISSRQNEQVKALIKLKLQKERKKQNKFLAEGVRVCKTLIESGALLENLYTTERTLDTAKKLASDNKIIQVTEPVMAKISTVSTPSGLVGSFQIPSPPSPEKLSSGLILAQIADPGNMGTLIRSCAAMGFTSVVTIEGADPWGPKSVQASAGQIINVNIFKWSWQELLKHKAHLKLLALVVEGGKPPKDVALKNALLVVGSEAHGIPKAWIHNCDDKLTIPMPGKTESLNAAVAGSIALYAALYN